MILISALFINGACLCSPHNSIDSIQNYSTPKKNEELKRELSSVTNQKASRAKNLVSKLENCKTKKCLASESLIDSDEPIAGKKEKILPKSPLEKKELNPEKFKQLSEAQKWPPEDPSLEGK